MLIDCNASVLRSRRICNTTRSAKQDQEHERKKDRDRDRPLHRQRPRRRHLWTSHSRSTIPPTGEAEKTVALASSDEVGRVVASAVAAWPAWAKTPSLRRARILDRFKTILWERADQLAEVISAEHGKTHDDAKGEVTRGLEVVEFAVGAPHLLKGEITENVGTGVDSHSLRQPLGVVAGITPFNFPVMVPMWMFPVAHRLRQLLHPQAVRARPVAVAADRRVAGRGRAAQGRLQRRPGRQGGGRRAPRHTPTSRRSASSVRPRSRATSTRPAPPTGNGCRRSAARRTTW